MLKAELRKNFLNQQESLSEKDRCEKSGKVVKFLFSNFDFGKMSFLNCFITLEKNNELETFEIFQKLWREFPEITTTAPRINFETDELESIVVLPDAKFVKNKWGILEPASDELIDAKKLDAVLVPLIAFDELGFRVGYGKGFYDKFLIKCRADCQKIGLSLFPPVGKITDAADFDVKLDYCITPERVWKFG